MKSVSSAVCMKPGIRLLSRALHHKLSIVFSDEASSNINSRNC